MSKSKRSPEAERTAELSQLYDCLRELKLYRSLELLDEELSRLSKGESTAQETLLRLLRAQAEDQRERRIERRIREAHLPERKTLAAFDFDFQPSLSRALVQELMTMSFVSRREWVLLAGNSGTGKSHIAKALALEGCKQGYRVLYTTAAEMLRVLFASLADDSLERKLKRYVNPALLVIDELGFDRLEREDARNAALFFKVIDGRYDKRSTIITTNIDFEQLGHYLGDPVVTTAIVDRMVHHSTVLSTKGPSYRLEESKQLNQQKNQQSAKPRTSARKTAAGAPATRKPPRRGQGRQTTESPS